jgi:hypothetical protein
VKTEDHPVKGRALSEKKEKHAAKETFNTTSFSKFLVGPGRRQARAVFLAFGMEGG